MDDIHDYDSDDEDRGEPVEFIPINDGALPRHIRCASHTLSRIGTKDADDASSDPIYHMKFTEAFAKLNALCKKYNRPKSSELIKSMLKSSLVMPCATRWNSLYDSISRLLKFDVNLLNEINVALSLDSFLTADMEFFQEYVTVMQPIADAIDSLQSDTYYSYFLPTLTSIKYSLESMAAEDNLKHCQPLLEAITNGFEKRFGHFFEMNDDRCLIAVMSTCIHPYFKTRWLHEDMHAGSHLSQIENLLVREAISIEKETAAPSVKQNNEDEE